MSATIAPSDPQPPPARKRHWAPRMWIGCELPALWRLLADNRFAVGLPYWYIVVIDLLVAPWHTLLRWCQAVVFGRRIRASELSAPPVFVIGHWRTGTTLMHELLACDPDHTTPSTLHCFNPGHFLVTHHITRTLFGWVLPAQRPMDDMVTSWDHPQEDEFALCLMGLPSPYRDIAFPNHLGDQARHLNPDDFPADQRHQWQQALRGFLQRVHLQAPGRMVLKSPPHTCRIAVLLEMFPDARFVHIVRHPYDIYSSTLKLWDHLFTGQGLQRPDLRDLHDYVLNTFVAMDAHLQAALPLVDPRQFITVRYEELTADPLNQIRAIYAHFGWDFAAIEPPLTDHLATIATYQPATHTLAPDLRHAIHTRWRAYFDRYGYEGGADGYSPTTVPAP